MGCKKKVDAKKKIDLWKLPQVLLIHLKRFEYDLSSGDFLKIDNHLSMPLELDLTQYCSSAQRDGALYEVACIANHSGQFDRGHYTATCRVSGSGRSNTTSLESGWYHFDDEHVNRVDEKDVVDPRAYVIFLTRSGDQPSIANHQTVTRPDLWPHLVSRQNSQLAELLPGRVGIGAAIACGNPRSAILPDEDVAVSEGDTQIAALPTFVSSDHFLDSLSSVAMDDAVRPVITVAGESSDCAGSSRDFGEAEASPSVDCSTASVQAKDSHTSSSPSATVSNAASVTQGLSSTVRDLLAYHLSPATAESLFPTAFPQEACAATSSECSTPSIPAEDNQNCQVPDDTSIANVPHRTAGRRRTKDICC